MTTADPTPVPEISNDPSPAVGVDTLTSPIPDGYKLHTEGSAHILLPETMDAFLNPVQQFNRDLSVAVITAFSEALAREKEAKYRESQLRSKRRQAREKREQEGNRMKLDSESQTTTESANTAERLKGVPTKQDTGKQQYTPQKIVILEALSATGLRSIRYAKEIPLVKHVIANDLSETAVEAMTRNIDFNGLGATEPDTSTTGVDKSKLGKVRVNHGDARVLMYSHTSEKTKVDVLDLDPYGSAAPFIDAAVQCVNDGGLLCVTCTDLSVLATNNYPEKCFANYGGVPAKAEYSHEIALRLVLHTISQSAARYKRYIEPLISLSIDFYIRVFVRIRTGPVHVKRALPNTSTFYICSYCQAHHDQPLGRAVEAKHKRTGDTNVLFKTQAGPPVSSKCPECESHHHVAGPMWNGPLHKPAFIGDVLHHIERSSEHKYGTLSRMKGMLTLAKEELDTHFYFTPATIAGHFHTVCPSLNDVASALLNGGHKVSRSHAAAGSLKTTATRDQVHDVFRTWIKTHPVRMDKIAEHSPSRVLLGKEASMEADFSKHSDLSLPSWKDSIVRYQQNPQPNWGPGTKAPQADRKKASRDGPRLKRKRDDDDDISD